MVGILIESFNDARILQTIIVGVFLVAILYTNVKNRHWTTVFALLFMIITYLPSSNFFIRVGFVFAERVLYLPSIGFSLSDGLKFENFIFLAIFNHTICSTRLYWFYVVGLAFINVYKPMIPPYL